MPARRVASAALITTVTMVGAALPAHAAPGGKPGPPGAAPEDPLPIVFVHGNSGSAQQFETQAQRFTSNGWPQDLLHAFEYDTSSGVPNPDDAVLGAFVDDVLGESGADRVWLMGHSRGTTVSTSYLESLGDATDTVAGYINVDGRDPDFLPGGVPSIGIWGEWNTAGSGNYRRGDRPSAFIGPDDEGDYYFPEKAHTEVMTSAAAFAQMWEFFTGEEPATTRVRPEPANAVSVAGRAALFPSNVGFPDDAGAELDVYRVNKGTGQRKGGPVVSVDLDSSGDFGPIDVHGRHAYEFAVTRPDGSVHHFYPEAFIRDDHFVRLQTSQPGTGLEAFTESSPETTNLVLTRQKELWGDQGRDNDSITVDGTEVVTPRTAPRSDTPDLNVGTVNAMFVYDVGLDGVSDVEVEPFGVPFPFYALSFLSAADLSIAASEDASGTVKVRERSRTGGATTIAVPNWPSDDHRISILLRDGE